MISKILGGCKLPNEIGFTVVESDCGIKHSKQHPNPNTTPTPSHNVPTIFAIKIFSHNRKHTYQSVHPIQRILFHGNMKRPLESMSICLVSLQKLFFHAIYSLINHRWDADVDTVGLLPVGASCLTRFSIIRLFLLPSARLAERK